MKHECLVLLNLTPVAVEYDIDSDGYVWDMDVTFKGINVNEIISDDDWELLKEQCLAAYLKQVEEDKFAVTEDV